MVLEVGVRGWWTWAEVISQLRLIGPGCWLGAKHGGNRRFSFLSCRESRYSCACENRNFNFHLLPNKSGEEFLPSVLSFSLSIVGILGKNSYLQFFSFGSRCKRLASNSVLLSARLESARGSRQLKCNLKIGNLLYVKAQTFSSSKN